MKNLHCIFVAWLLLSALYACQNSSKDPFFDNLTGKWQIDGREIVETWQKGTNSDTTYTAQVIENINGKFLLREQIFITPKDGQIYYNAKIKRENGGKSVPFQLTSVTPTMAVFENPKHSFPQKITYQLKDNYQTLVTEISGTMEGGEPQSFSFTHHRKK